MTQKHQFGDGDIPRQYFSADCDLRPPMPWDFGIDQPGQHRYRRATFELGEIETDPLAQATPVHCFGTPQHCHYQS